MGEANHDHDENEDLDKQFVGEAVNGEGAIPEAPELEWFARECVDDRLFGIWVGQPSSYFLVEDDGTRVSPVLRHRERRHGCSGILCVRTQVASHLNKM